MSESEHGGIPAGQGLPASPGPELPEHDPVAPGAVTVEPPAGGDSVEALAEFIVAETGPPIDVWAIAALLESTGIRDRDAVERFGRPDVFALARDVERRMPEPEFPERPAPARASLRARLERVARIYGRGTFFFVPLTLQLIALLAVGISTFAAIDFTNRQASLVAAAAALSFVVTSGLVQSLGYLAPIYIESGKHMLAEKVCWWVLGVGALVALAVGAAVWGIVALAGGYPPDDLRIAAAYYALMAAQGLIGALLYILRKFVAMIAATIVALAVAGILYKHSSLPVEQIHWIALAAGIALQLLVGIVVLHRRAANTVGDLRLSRLPRKRLLFRRTFPFGAYGLVYFFFLTVDRVLAWASGDHPLPLWFQSPYELGLDWALGAIILSLAFLEITVENFSAMLVPTADRFGVDAVRGFNREMSRFWAKQLAYVGALAAFGAWVAVAIAVALHELGALGRADHIYSDPVTRYVFGIGVLGYAALALGIANSVFLMSLNRPERAIAAIVPGALVSVGVGLVATMSHPYWTAIFGMLAGAATFAAIGGWQTWRTLRHADYYNYSAW